MFRKKNGKSKRDNGKFNKKCNMTLENAAKRTADSISFILCIRIGIIVAALMLMLSTLLPYMVFHGNIRSDMEISSLSLLTAEKTQAGSKIIYIEIIYIIIALTVILFVFFKKKINILICGIFSALIYFIEISMLKKQFAELLEDADIWNYVSVGNGYHLLTFSMVLLLVLGILYFIFEKQMK